MHTRSDIARYVRLSIKTVILTALYLLFAFYTVPTYNVVRAFVSEHVNPKDKVIVIGMTSVAVEIVDDAPSRERGLSGRESLEWGTGMFFVFDKPGTYPFWMKEMKFAIDILWFDQYGELVYIKENATPASFPETFGPSKDSMYVLEVPAGFAKAKNLRVGDKIDFY